MNIERMSALTEKLNVLSQELTKTLREQELLDVDELPAPEMFSLITTFYLFARSEGESVEEATAYAIEAMVGTAITAILTHGDRQVKQAEEQLTRLKQTGHSVENVAKFEEMVNRLKAKQERVKARVSVDG